MLCSSKECSGLPSSALALQEDGRGMLAFQESRPQHPRFKYCAPTYAQLYTPRQFRLQTLAIQIRIWSFVRWYSTPDSYASWTLLLGLWAPAASDAKLVNWMAWVSANFGVCPAQKLPVPITWLMKVEVNGLVPPALPGSILCEKEPG